MLWLPSAYLGPMGFVVPGGPVGLDRCAEPDGTTAAWRKDQTKVLHSHGPRPARG